MQSLVGADASLYHVWQVPGKLVSICVSRDVIGGILRRGKGGRLRPSRRRTETGGILLGTAEHEGEHVTVRIEESLEVPCEHLFGPAYSLSDGDKETLRTTLRKAKSQGRFFPVGFYRTHARRGCGLDADDLLLFSEFFPDATDLALLVKRRTVRSNRAAFFFREDGVEQSKPSLEVPVSGNRRKGSGAPEPADKQEKQEKPEGAACGRRGLPLWCSWWMQAPLVLCLLFADGLMGFSAAQQVNKLVPAESGPRDPYALSLMVFEYGNNLHLTWDRRALPIAAGERGLLLITDGEQTRSMDLTPSQLQSASVVYRRVNSQVRFRLEVLLKDRRSVSETWESPGGAYTKQAATTDSTQAAAHP